MNRIAKTLIFSVLASAGIVDGGSYPRYRDSRQGIRARSAPPTPMSRSIGAHRRTPARPAALYCEICARDTNGRIARSPAARREFRRANPCPATGENSRACPGYVIDHVVPLKRGGPDEPNNMQWQTIEEAKAKDRVE